MKITFAMVMSADGKTTKWDNANIYEWTSKEDQEWFFELIDKHNLIIMGRKTFEAAKAMIKLSPQKLRIVITQNPEKYQDIAVPGQLQFTNKNPQQIVKKYKELGYTEALLVGGQQIALLFFKEKLIHELLLTVEPYVFGAGANLISKDNVDVQMKLINITKLNAKGTILIHYAII